MVRLTDHQPNNFQLQVLFHPEKKLFPGTAVSFPGQPSSSPVYPVKDFL
jgi:hypothetical protein